MSSCIADYRHFVLCIAGTVLNGSIADGRVISVSCLTMIRLTLQVVDLASIMQLDLGTFSSLSPKLKSVCKKIQERMAMKP